MVAFRGTKLFDVCNGPNIDYPPRSRTLSLADGRDIHRVSTFAVYQDVLRDAFQPSMSTPQRFAHNYSKTMASSTYGGLDLYTHDSVKAIDRKSEALLSCFDQLDDDLAFDARLAFSLEKSLEAECDSVCDEGFFEQGGNAGHLKSHFSTTTTSTSNYVEVARFLQESDAESKASMTWSTLEAPDESDTPGTSIDDFHCRLRKRRPSHLQAPLPSDTSERSSTPLNKTKCARLIHCLLNFPRFKRESSLDERWVCVDVTQCITQRLV